MNFTNSSLFAANLSRLAPHQLTFDLCFLSRQLHRRRGDHSAGFPTCNSFWIIAAFPTSRTALDPWRERIRELSSFPNLACKISGVVAYCDPQRVNAEAIRPYVEHCIECFGWDRVLFGGDWPVCNLTSSLGRWVEIAKEIVGKESRTNQEKFFAGNAERIYRLKQPG